MLRFFPNLGVHRHKPAEWGFGGLARHSDPVYRRPRRILDTRRWWSHAGDGDPYPARWPTDDQTAGGRAGRARPNDPLLQEVRWRLFRREDLPARLRRLERLEDTAFGPEPQASPPRMTREKPASSIVPWPGTSSYPVAGSVASTRPAGWSASMPRQSARITLVNDVNFLLYTPFLPEAAAGMLEPRHVVTPLRDVLDQTHLRLGRRGRARPGTAHGDAAGSGGLRARAALRPPGRRPRLGVARAADPRAGRACDRVQEPRRRDLAAESRDPVHGGGGHVR